MLISFTGGGITQHSYLESIADRLIFPSPVWVIHIGYKKYTSVINFGGGGFTSFG